MLPSLQSITPETLKSQLVAWKQPAYRSDQILDWVYHKRAVTVDSMSNLPKDLKEHLEKNFKCYLPDCMQKQGSDDTTQKFLWKLNDGALVESVLIPANPALYGEASDRHTLCISTQVGCAYGCKFCASGLDGWKRNLEPEVVERIMRMIEKARKEGR